MPPKGRGRIRGRKAMRGKKLSPLEKKKVSSYASDEEQDEEIAMEEDSSSTNQFDDEQHESASIDIVEDISKLEAPTFTTIDRGPPEPLHNSKKLKWDYKVNLIGEKVVNPLLHCCEKCSLPILIYGRMIPCKHVFCFDCGKAAGSSCPRCHDKVTRVEQSALGTVFMCMYGGSRHGHNGCRRTYLSQRDLQAHINHRHLRPSDSSEGGSRLKSSPKYDQSSSASKSPGSVPPSSRDPRCQTISQATLAMQQLMEKHHSQATSSSMQCSSTTSLSVATQPTSVQTYATPIPVMSTRTNLITVPIQDNSAQSTLQSVGGSATDYVAFSSTPLSNLQQTSVVASVPASVHAPAYQLQVSNPYIRTPIQQPTVPVSYTSIPPTTYTTPISTAQVLAFSQPPPAHPTHLPPPPIHNPAVPVQQIYSAPPPAVQRPSLTLQPGRATGVPRQRQQFQSSGSYDEVPVGSPPYQWQGNTAAPRAVVPPSRTSNYRPHYYQ